MNFTLIPLNLIIIRSNKLPQFNYRDIKTGKKKKEKKNGEKSRKNEIFIFESIRMESISVRCEKLDRVHQDTA